MAARPQNPDLSAIVVLDSNALFTENDIEVVNKEFFELLPEFSKFGAEFIIPKTVIRELQFRKLNLLKRLEGEVRKGISSIGKLTNSSLPSFPSAFSLALRLSRRWRKICRDNKIRVVGLSYKDVNWAHLCSASIHRRPPFSPFDPNGKSEKGFRDAIILETLKQICIASTGKKIVFLCNDALLQNAAKKLLSGDKFESYTTTGEYLSYLRLENSNFINSLIAYIIDEGARAFYTKDDQECIYLKFSVPEKIQSKFSVHLDKKPLGNAFELGMLTPRTYADVTGEGIQLGETSVRGYAAASSTLSFTTGIRFAKAIQSSNQWEQEQVRIVEFKVDWSSAWNGQLLVSPKEIGEIHAGNVTFEPSTDALLSSFNLPTKIQRVWQGSPHPQQETNK